MKWLMKILMALVLLVPAQAWAFENEPNGFRDLYWGETLGEVQRNRETRYDSYVQVTNSVLYAVKLNEKEPQVLSNVPIWGNVFLAAFWNDKLWNVTLFFDGKEAFERLKWAMTELYGASKEVGGDCMWIGNKTVIMLLRMNSAGSEGCSVRISSINLMAEMSEAEARRGW